jgi:hypothetical protein
VSFVEFLTSLSKAVLYSDSETTMAAIVDTPRKLWEHPSPQSTRMGIFKAKIERSKAVKFAV